MVRFLNCIILEDETNFRSNKWLNLTPTSLLAGVGEIQLCHVTPSVSLIMVIVEILFILLHMSLFQLLIN